MRVAAIGYENRRDIIPHCGKVKCPNGPCVDEPLGYMYPCKRETKRITIDLDQKLLEERIQMCHRALKTYTNKYQKDVIREKNKVETYTITAFGNKQTFGTYKNIFPVAPGDTPMLNRPEEQAPYYSFQNTSLRPDEHAFLTSALLDYAAVFTVSYMILFSRNTTLC